MAPIARAHEELLQEIQNTHTPEGQAAFWWMGQHTFIVKAANRVFYLDPWFAPWESRQTPPLLHFHETRLADFALISHGHADHLCPQTLQHMVHSSPNALFIAPRTEQQRLLHEAAIPPERLRTLNAGETLQQHSVRITAIKAKHEFFDEQPGIGFPYLGYVVEAGGVTFYHAGDTLIYEGLLTTLRQWPRIHALFLPINGRDPERFLSGCLGNMTYQEAVELAGELQPAIAVPAHYDMFLGNQEDPDRFVRYLSAKYPGIPYWVGPAGQRVFFPQ